MIPHPTDQTEIRASLDGAGLRFSSKLTNFLANRKEGHGFHWGDWLQSLIILSPDAFAQEGDIRRQMMRGLH